MTRIRQRMFLIPVAMLAIVALMGTSLGVLTAKAMTERDLFLGNGAGLNLVGSGVDSGATLTPEQWTACLPPSQWKAVYTFDNTTKLWSHYFNPETTGVPDYVNEIGGITSIRSTTAAYVVVLQNITDAQFPENVTEANTCLN
ncbi:MAG TPA: hypothetical protein VFK32_00340 [Tepidiformaceae bacterium]|nr:hypothetical protein [Tepidiformaceae bacterium]